MKKSLIFWILAFIITVAAGYYQRLTGPTYAVTGNTNLDGNKIIYSLDRSHGGETDHLVLIKTDDPSVEGVIKWKRFKTNDEWQFIEMKYQSEMLTGFLPHQPPAGKLEYQVILKNDQNEIIIPAKPVVIRFKGYVPLYVLIPHIIFIFAAMLLSNRTAFECFVDKPKFKTYTIWTFILLLIGGMILGPVVQKFAFGEYWTGFPFGTDLTDNKTLIAFIGWIAALITVFKSKTPKVYILIAAIIMFIIFIIPHSLFGSELDYSSLE
jgi:hypothetical protein